MRVDGIFLEVKPVLSSCPRFRALCLGCCGLEGWSVTDVLRENFLSEAKGTGERVGISFSVRTILSVWRIEIRRVEPGDLQIGESTSGSWTSLLGSGSVF
jgi:hypothetical protein